MQFVARRVQGMRQVVEDELSPIQSREHSGQNALYALQSFSGAAMKHKGSILESTNSLAISGVAGVPQRTCRRDRYGTSFLQYLRSRKVASRPAAAEL